MNPDNTRPSLPPLWTGRPTTIDRASSGGCSSRCSEIKALLAQTTSSPMPPICADCQDGAPIEIVRLKN